jgi:hypothetical protein
VVSEQCQQDDYWDWHSEEPQQNSASHDESSRSPFLKQWILVSITQLAAFGRGETCCKGPEQHRGS